MLSAAPCFIDYIIYWKLGKILHFYNKKKKAWVNEMFKIKGFLFEQFIVEVPDVIQFNMLHCEITQKIYM